MAITGFTAKGQSLRTPGWELTDVGGWDTYPSWGGENVRVANRHGVWTNTRRFANSRSLELPMVIFPYDPVTGAQTLDPNIHLQNNLDTILGLLYGDMSEVGIVRTMPDGTTRTIQGEVIDAIPVDGRAGVKTLALRFDCAYPFWHGSAVSDLANSGTFSVTNAGNAPVGDALFTFTGVAKLTHNDTGDSFEITAGANTEVDAGARTIQRASVDVDEDFQIGDTGYWIELIPGVNSFTLTGAGTVDVEFMNGYL